MIAYSPLRYPGGKQVLAPVLLALLRSNGLQSGVYAEPYAGGAGAALALLLGEHVDRVRLNDADPCVYAFWRSILDDTDRFVERIRRTKLTMASWYRYRRIYLEPKRHSRFEVGFATFF